MELSVVSVMILGSVALVDYCLSCCLDPKLCPGNRQCICRYGPISRHPLFLHETFGCKLPTLCCFFSAFRYVASGADKGDG